jgi:hypothetical protein
MADYRANWPARPYKGFSNYGPDDVPLFAGRDREVEHFGRLLSRADTRVVLLHGPSGCGKSSFLRAGVIPYLENRYAGFSFVKDPNDPAVGRTSSDKSAVFIRSTSNPLATLATAVYRIADKGFDPSGTGDGWLTLDEAKLGCASLPEFVARVSAEPLDLITSLQSLAADLPPKLVLVVDQAEEVVTLRRRGDSNTRADRFFAFVNAFGQTRWPLTLIVSLRTEYFGVLQNQIGQQSIDGATGVHDYYLDELKRADILEAIVRPTLATPVRRFGVPRDVYQFAYEEGLPERLAQDVFKEADEGGLVSGVLPFLQVVCESLLSVTRQRKTTTGLLTITHEDYTPGKVLETMTQYVDDVIDAFLREQQTGAIDLARSRWKDVIAFLARTQSDGSMTAQIKTIDELRSIAESFAAPYGDRMLAYLADDERGILRRDPIADPESGTVVERFSLRHDAIGLILSQWRTQRETYQQELVFKDGIRVFMPGVDEIQLTCSFDETGSGAHVRRWIGLRSRQTVLDFRIPYSLGVSPPGRVGALVLTSLDQPQPSALPVRFVVEESHDDRLRGFVEIQGQLGANTGFVGFETRHPIERAFYMKREDIEKGYARELWKTEYAGVFVQLPTGRLDMTVQFPASFQSPRLEAGPVVFIGSGEKAHDAEIARVRASFRLGDGEARLTVEEPLQGLLYGIYWMPPS